MWQRAVVPARRRCARIGWVNRRTPWRLWCALGAADALTVAWVIATRAGRPLRFLQIGSNDGVLHDPIHQVVESCGWTGVLVEPLGDLFDQLVANYDGVPGVGFENVALGTTDGTTTMYRVDPRPDDPYWVGLLASFDRDLILSKADVLTDVGDRLIEVAVETVALETLVRRNGLETIDLLHVDAEGYDYAVLEQIDFAAPWAPAFIIYEKEHFDAATRRAARRLLADAGYACVDIWPDEFAYRVSPEALGGGGGRAGRGVDTRGADVGELRAAP
jgi:FkbM family methyltransferase